jgi:protein Mpv17
MLILPALLSANRPSRTNTFPSRRQQLLESSFPSHTLRPTTEALAAAAHNDDSLLDKEESEKTITEPKLSLRNTLTKFALDQSLSAALNTLAFSLAMGAFQGLDYVGAVGKAREEFWPLMRAGWRLWPVVSMVNFTMVRSVQGRALVGSLAGMGWGIYLSLVAGASR